MSEMSVEQSTYERFKECLRLPRTTLSLTVRLGLRLNTVQQMIREHRKELVVVDWLSHEGQGRLSAVYLLKRGPWNQVDAPKPVYPRGGRPGKNFAYERRLKKIQHQFRVDTLFAQTDQERKEARDYYEACYQKLWREANRYREADRTRSRNYAKRMVAAQNAASNPQPMIPVAALMEMEEVLPVRRIQSQFIHGTPVPVNQDAFWIRSTA